MSTVSPTKSADFSLARPRGVCHVTQTAILPGESFMAALRETPSAFERLDIKLTAWETFDRTGIVGYWKTVMPIPGVKKKMLVDDAVLCDLLERLEGTESAEKQCFRFVLALILMRKRLVVCDATHHAADHDLWTIRIRGREQSMSLIDPRPDEAQIAMVREQLAQILSEDA